MLRRVLVLAVLTAAAACGGGDPSPSASPTPSPPGATETASPVASESPGSVASGVPSDSAEQTISLTVSKGKVTGDTGRVKVRLGARLRITVTADVADEIHVHVYDLKQEISANSPGSVEFVADKSGVIPVELERAKLTLTRLVVS